MTEMNVTENLLQLAQKRCDAALLRWLPNRSEQRLFEALHYAVFNGGKRLRPALVYATGECFNADIEVLDYAAAAIELIHCYSLVHDDLPAMDDDDLRRGKPSCHKAFDEATAILVGDALQCHAFEILSMLRDAPERKLQLAMLRTLAHASGSYGMVAGQALDLLSEGKILQLDALKDIYQLKTSALIKAAVKLGALSAGQSDPFILEHLCNAAEHIGLAFQIQDDILDIEGNPDITGKATGNDQRCDKNTYPMLVGVTQAKQDIERLKHAAEQSLDQVSVNTDQLKHLFQFIINREF